MKMMNVNKVVSTYDDIKCQSEDKQYSPLAQQSWINSSHWSKNWEKYDFLA
jgi:hypothetical protein